MSLKKKFMLEVESLPVISREYQPLNSPDVLLVLPPLYQSGREPDYNPKEPMGLMYLAASLRQDKWNVRIFDADIEAKTITETVDRILVENPLIVGFSVFQRALPSFKLIVNQLRAGNYRGHIVCGGITPTLSYSYILEEMGGEIDAIVLGEGERILRNLVNRMLSSQDWHSLPGVAYLADSIQVINRPIEVVDLDTISFASRDYLDYCCGKTNYATILGSRGCYGQCTFCSNFSFGDVSPGPHWRGRNSTSIVDEIQDIYEEKGITVFKFNDPNIFGPGRKGRGHVLDFCREVVRRKLPLHLMGFCRSDDIISDPQIAVILRAAGFERLLIGIESSDNEILQKFRKGETIEEMEQSMDILTDAGISTVAGFMIFNPYTTVETLKNDLTFLERKGLTPTLSKALRIFDGTPIQALMEEEGRLVKKNPFEGYHDYLMPRDVAAIYASMKALYKHCLDKIRAVGQGNIWNIKKASSFRDRRDFNSLSEAFFDTEAFVLRNLIRWAETSEFSKGDIEEMVKELYGKLDVIGNALSIDTKAVISPSRVVVEEIYGLTKERPWDTFREEYRWNGD